MFTKLAIEYVASDAKRHSNGKLRQTLVKHITTCRGSNSGNTLLTISVKELIVNDCFKKLWKLTADERSVKWTKREKIANKVIIYRCPCRKVKDNRIVMVNNTCVVFLNISQCEVLWSLTSSLYSCPLISLDPLHVETEACDL